jgi:hypothetical protein
MKLSPSQRLVLAAGFQYALTLACGNEDEQEIARGIAHGLEQFGQRNRAGTILAEMETEGDES